MIGILSLCLKNSVNAASLIIATRESRLALWQAHHVQALLRERGKAVELLGMTTQGDQILDRTLSKVGGKGLFVKELEVALEEGRADLAVHSLKDVPMELPAGFALACVMEREDPRDAWVSSRYPDLQSLPQLQPMHHLLLQQRSPSRAAMPPTMLPTFNSFTATGTRISTASSISSSATRLILPPAIRTLRRVTCASNRALH